jgi:hypothetical protein
MTIHLTFSGRRSAAAIVVLGIVLCVPRSGAAQRGTTTQAPTPQHAPTCAARLREYASPADVGAPFDTLQMRLGMVQLSPEEFRPFMLARMAEAGATGFLTRETTQANGAKFVQFVPLFVPSDSARIRSACDADRRPPGGA